jgi:oligopeptidase A
MLAARRFMGGWYQMRQISFGTIDLALHAELAPRLDPEGADESETDPGQAILTFVEERLLPFSPGPTFARNHVLTSFTHLFSGGYAAGYYSYLWSEVLDADAFTRFKKEGVFNPDTGRAYLDAILSRGDSADPEELFREFMGRDPDPSALLERNLGPLPA